MKKTVCLAFLACSAIAYADVRTIPNAMSVYRGGYSKPLKCWLSPDKETGGAYCMKFKTQKTVETPEGRLEFVLFTGNHIDTDTMSEDGIHAHSGRSGIFVFRRENGIPVPVASAPYISAGSFGNAPEQWTFHRFGEHRWGFLTQHCDAHQGYSGCHYVINVYDGKRIVNSWIGAESDNTSALVCEELKGEERRRCLDKEVELESTIKIRRDLPATAGFYPLEIKVSGRKGRKNIAQTFVIPYRNAKTGYAEPKNYLFRNLDY